MSFPDLSRMAMDITDDHMAVRDMMLRFAEERLHPGAAERDETRGFPVEQINELAAMGGMAMKVAEADDGPGLDNTAYALAIEALSRFDPSVAVSAIASNLSVAILDAHATEVQRDRWVRPVARGEKGAVSFGLSEPNAGSDAAAIRTNARLDGDDWVLNGSKQWITSGSNAEIFVIFAKTSDKSVSCFVVEKGTPGFTLGRREQTMGLCSSGTSQLFFEDCRLPAENLIGAVDRGYKLAIEALAPSRIAVAAQSLGIAERAYQLGLDYAREREAFGKPLTGFQNTQFMLADCRTELDAAWLVMLRGARLLDQGIEIASEASMAKLMASEVCGRVVDRMLQLHGGAGYSREFEIERLYRDARIMRIFEGTSEIQRGVISREILAG